MKLFLEIYDKNQILPSQNEVEYVVGLKGVSLRAPFEFSWKDIDEFIGLAEKNGQ